MSSTPTARGGGSIQPIAFPSLVIGASALAGAALAVWQSASPAVWSALVVGLFAIGIVGWFALRPIEPRVGLRLASSPTHLAVAGASLFVLGTAVGWAVDFRNDHFFTAGWPVVLFNVWRLFLLAFFVAVFRGTGSRLRAFLEHRYATSLADGMLERLVVDGIIGAAIWIEAMYVAGVAGLYFRPLTLIVAAVAGAIGIRETVRDRLAARTMRTDSAQPDRVWSASAAAGLGVLVGVVVAALTIRLALGGISDEYDSSHYLPYYEQVVRNHGTTLNDYWYHFWITKGAGLQFLAVLVGDIFSPALVSFALLLLTACFVASFVRRSLPGNRALSRASVVLFLSPFLTEFPYQQKQHFVGMALIVASAWTAAWLCQPNLPSLRPGLGVLALLTGAAVLCSVPFAAPLCLWLALLVVGLTAASRPRQHVLGFLAAASAPVALVVAIVLLVLTLNVVWVGMGEASPFKLFFEHADQSRLARYISPYLVLFLEEASSESTGRLTWESVLQPDFSAISHLLHLDYLQVGARWLLVILALAAVALLFRRVRKRLGWPAFCLVAALGSAGLLSILISQPGSLFRVYLFTFPLAVITLIVGLTALIQLVGDRRAGLKGAIAAVLATVLAVHDLALAGVEFSAKRAADRFARNLRFIAGQESLATSIGTLATCEKMASTFDSLPGPAGSAVRPEAKVWTLTFLLPVGCYVLPRPRVLMEVSAGMGPHWHRIVFGPEDMALRELDRLGVDYFYVDLADFDPATSTKISSSLMGCLAYSPLFDPQALRRHFRVMWREGDAFLLATAGAAPDGTPVPDDFIQRWPGKRDKLQYGLGQMKELCGRVADYYAARAERWPVQADRSLPRLKGWQ